MPPSVVSLAGGSGHGGSGSGAGGGARHGHSAEGPNEGATGAIGLLRRPLLQIVVLFASDSRVLHYSRALAHRVLKP